MFQENRHLILLTSFLWLRPCPVAAAGEAVSLDQCYGWARERSEDLKRRGEDIVQARERGRAALGGLFPRLEWEYTDTRQHPAGVEELNRRGFSGFVEKDQVESHFSLKQPLFSGLKEVSAWSGFRKQRARDVLRLERASRELFEAVAEAFYAVLERESEGANTGAALALAQDRVKELTAFRRLGKARDSEVFTAQARAAALRAELRQIQARVASAREDLALLAGQDLSSVALRDDIPSPPPVASLEEGIAAARQRADLRAQREEVEAWGLRVRFEKGSYWPSLDVTGNYYTRRAAYLDAIDWDVALSLKAPLFQGGSVAARVREAESGRRQATLALEELERKVVHEVRKVHTQLFSAVEEARALEEAAEAAQKSYDALLEEYRLGLVTNLDVLAALDVLQDQNRARDLARLEAKMLYIRLKVKANA